MSWTLDRLVIPAQDADHEMIGDRTVSRFYLADVDPVGPGLNWPALELRTFHDPRLKRYWAVLSSVTISDTPDGLAVHHGHRSPTRIVLEAVMPRFDQRTFARFDVAAQAAARTPFHEAVSNLGRPIGGDVRTLGPKVRGRQKQSAA